MHLVRNSLRYVADKDSRPVVTDLKRIYQAPTLAQAERALETLAERWDHKYPSLSTLWLRHWEQVITVGCYPEDIRRAITPPAPWESLNSVIRKAINNQRIFPVTVPPSRSSILKNKSTFTLNNHIIVSILKVG